MRNLETKRENESDLREWFNKFLYPENDKSDSFIRIKKNGEKATHRFSLVGKPLFLPEYARYTTKKYSPDPELMTSIKALEPTKNIQRGLPFGNSVNETTTHVRQLSLDMDRHHCWVDPDQHLQTSIEAYHLVEDYRKEFFHSGSSNPNNGSSKLFLYQNSLEPIEIAKATDFAEELKEELFNRTGTLIEVFPAKGDKSLWTPFREDKDNCFDVVIPRHKRNWYLEEESFFHGRWSTEEEVLAIVNSTNDPERYWIDINYPELPKRKARVHYECYDLQFIKNRLTAGGKYRTDLKVWTDLIKKGMAALPYKSKEQVQKEEEAAATFEAFHAREKAVSKLPVKPADAVPAAKHTIKPVRQVKLSQADRKRSEDVIKNWKPEVLDELRLEPNSFSRQFESCRILSVKLRRPAEIQEALDFIEENDLYTGGWHDNAKEREDRVEACLEFISKTFNPKLCSSGSWFEFDPTAWKRWFGFVCSQKFKGTEFKAVRKSYQNCRINISTLETIGDGREYIQNYNMTKREYALYAYLLDACSKSSKYGDGGCPEDRIRPLWNLLKAAGKFDFVFDENKFRKVRNELHNFNVIKCDYKKSPKKSYCYKEGAKYPFQEQWKFKELTPARPSSKRISFSTIFLGRSAPRKVSGTRAQQIAFSSLKYGNQTTLVCTTPAVDSLDENAEYVSSVFTITPHPLNSVDVKSESEIIEIRQNDLLNRPPP